MIQAINARKLVDRAKLTIVDEKMVKLEERIIELSGENISYLNISFSELWRRPIIIQRLREAGFTVKEFWYTKKIRVMW